MAANALKLNRSHFAYLRAVAQGIDPAESAKHFLGMEHGHQLKRLHRDLVQQLRALARRDKDSRWRLIGIALPDQQNVAAPATVEAPSLDEWAEEEGLQCWSLAELLEMYQAAHPVSASTSRRLAKLAILQNKQLAVLAKLEAMAAVPAHQHDPLSAWFDPNLVTRLNQAGWLTLGDLASVVRRGGRWWRSLPGIGPNKAADLRGLLAALLGPEALLRPSPRPSPLARSTQAGNPTQPEGAAWALALHQVTTSTLDGSTGTNRAPQLPRIDSATDTPAIRAWVELRAGSAQTAKTYLREATRWQMWCVLERGKPLSSATPQDCLAYMQFLQRIPEAWISRERAARLAQGWTPFRGQLALDSRKQAVKILNILCTWLTMQRYLDSNPWAGVNVRLVEGDELPAPPTSRALSVEAYKVLLDYLDNDTSAACDRNRFVVVFLRHTGLRASELVSARLGDLSFDQGWRLHVVGKGRKPRLVTMTAPAVSALETYLLQRGIDASPLRQAGQAAVSPAWCAQPLLASVVSTHKGVSYPSLHDSFKAMVRRAMTQGTLSPSDRQRCQRATTHWMRHTFATRYAEAGGEPSVLQAELGQADPKTTAGYYRAVEKHRRSEMERIAGLTA